MAEPVGEPSIFSDVLNKFADAADDVAAWRKQQDGISDFLEEHVFRPQALDEFNEGTLRELVRHLWAFAWWSNKDYVVQKILQTPMTEI